MATENGSEDAKEKEELDKMMDIIKKKNEELDKAKAVINGKEEEVKKL